MRRLVCKLVGHRRERITFKRARIAVHVTRCERCKRNLRVDAPGVPHAAVPRTR